MVNLVDYGVDPETSSVLHRIQLVSRLHAAATGQRSAQESVKLLGQLCSVLERLLHLARSSTEETMVEGLAKAYRLAAALHVFVPLSGYFPDPTLLIAGLVRDLKASTARSMHKGKVRTDLLLWLLAVGGNSAHAMPERVWYVAHLVNVVRELGIQWATMRQSLVKFTLHNTFCDKSFHHLWKEVYDKQD